MYVRIGAMLAALAFAAACSPPPADEAAHSAGETTAPSGDAPAPSGPTATASSPAGLAPSLVSLCDALPSAALIGVGGGMTPEGDAASPAPGCTWSKADATLRMNVYGPAELSGRAPAAKYDQLVAAHAGLNGASDIADINVRARIMGYGPNERDVAVLVETPTRVLEFIGSGLRDTQVNALARVAHEAVERAG